MVSIIDNFVFCTFLFELLNFRFDTKNDNIMSTWLIFMYILVFLHILCESSIHFVDILDTRILSLGSCSLYPCMHCMFLHNHVLLSLIYCHCSQNFSPTELYFYFFATCEFEFPSCLSIKTKIPNYAILTAMNETSMRLNICKDNIWYWHILEVNLYKV